MMCERENKEEVAVMIPAEMSHTGAARRELKKVDQCIADIVRALNQGGVYTRDSCCGHNKRDGRIVLWDGRMLLVKKSDFKTKEGLEELDEHLAEDLQQALLEAHQTMRKMGTTKQEEP